MTARPHVTILTSGIGFGVYIPALIVQRRLAEQGVNADVEVIEEYYRSDSLSSLMTYRERCRQNYGLARAAHRAATPVVTHLDAAAVDVVLHRWVSEGRTQFILWSGFWLPILERYRALVPDRSISRDLCRIDAEVSASFRVHGDLETGGREIWLWNADDLTLPYAIPVTHQLPVPFAERPRRLAVHGGGWSLGTYTETTRVMSRAGYALDVVVATPDEATFLGSDDRCWFVKPGWEPWQRTESGDHAFPPMEGLARDGSRLTSDHPNHHGFHDVLRHVHAIVSKPGGCTLIDSLAAHTPVVLLDAYGQAEAANAKVWRAREFGLSFDDWSASGFASRVLRKKHAALAAAPPPRDYTREYAARARSCGTAA